MFVPLGLFLAIAACWSAYWFYARADARDRLARLESEGPALACAERDWGGYPFRIYFDCTRPEVRIAGITASAAKLRLITQAWNRNHVLGAVFGPSRAGDVSFDHEPLRFSFRRTMEQFAVFSLIGNNLNARYLTGQPVSVASAALHLRPAPAPETPQGRLDVAVRLKGLASGDIRLDTLDVNGTVPAPTASGGETRLLAKASNSLDLIWLLGRFRPDGYEVDNETADELRATLSQHNGMLPAHTEDNRLMLGPLLVIGN